MRPEGIVREPSAAVWYAGLAGLPAFNPDQDGDSVAEAVADLGTLASWHHASMSAYVISEVEVLDEAQGQRYRELAAASIARYGGRYIVRGAEPEVPEGEWSSAQRVVIVEFPAMDHLHRWYDSPEYAEALAVRRSALSRRLLFAEGVSAGR